jgi:hypothetical protein
MIKEMYLEKGKMISIMKWNGGRMNQGWRGKKHNDFMHLLQYIPTQQFCLEPHRTRWYIGLVLICGDSLPYFNQLLVAKPAYFNQLQVSMA